MDWVELETTSDIPEKRFDRNTVAINLKLWRDESYLSHLDGTQSHEYFKIKLSSEKKGKKI